MNEELKNTFKSTLTSAREKYLAPKNYALPFMPVLTAFAGALSELGLLAEWREGLDKRQSLYLGPLHQPLRSKQVWYIHFSEKGATNVEASAILNPDELSLELQKLLHKSMLQEEIDACLSRSKHSTPGTLAGQHEREVILEPEQLEKIAHAAKTGSELTITLTTVASSVWNRARFEKYTLLKVEGYLLGSNKEPLSVLSMHEEEATGRTRIEVSGKALRVGVRDSSIM